MTVAVMVRHLLATAGAVALTSVGLLGAAAPAQAAACSGTSGVTVVVQSSAGTSVSCAGGDPSSAMSALKAAGHAVVMPSRFPGAICRIDGYPGSDPCVNMPPASAYWAFFHATSGGSWTYSQVGAGGHDPRPGSSVGFRFGSGSAPSVRPAAPAPAPAPKPTTAAPRPTTAPTSSKATSTPRRTTSVPRGTAGTTTATSTAPTATSGSRAAAPTGSTPAGRTAANPAATPTASLAPTPGTSPTGPSDTSASASSSPSATAVAAPPRPAPDADTGTSGTASLVGGGALLAGLAAAVAVVAVRRRPTG